MPAPIPLEPPVTRATLPVNDLACIVAINNLRFNKKSEFWIILSIIRFKINLTNFINTVGGKLKCPLFVASEMSGFKVVPSPIGLGLILEMGLQGKGALHSSSSPCPARRCRSFGRQGCSAAVIATQAMGSVGET